MAAFVDRSQIQQYLLDLGFDEVGFTPATPIPEEVEGLRLWLKAGYQADMAWMDNPKRQDIRLVMPEVRSLICVAINYYTPHQHKNDPQYAKISRYGWGRDYHRILHKKLKQFCQWLKQQGEGIEARYYADTGPVQDKLWAQRAGLGWIAKNGNLITRNYGSWVFLGEVLTNLVLEYDRPHTEYCGTCTRCLSACPTNAIAEPFVVDANRCIAYHTIENRAETLPPEIATNLNNWVAGCDICQDVCPWNERFAKPTKEVAFNPYPENLAATLEELATISDETCNERFTASALRRIKPYMWRRNAQANMKS